jgi:hypothetical protein
MKPKIILNKTQKIVRIISKYCYEIQVINLAIIRANLTKEIYIYCVPKKGVNWRDFYKAEPLQILVNPHLPTPKTLPIVLKRLGEVIDIDKNRKTVKIKLEDELKLLIKMVEDKKKNKYILA